MRENMGRELGYNHTCLWVIKGTWMEEWYKRRGYFHGEDNEREKNAVWVFKEL